MDNIFKNISNLSSEDIATEVLKHLLSNSKYSQFQKLFYNRVIGQFSTTAELSFELNTQLTFGSKGRPDLIIYNDEYFILIENKLGSGLSRDNQLLDYGEILNQLKKYEIKKDFLTNDFNSVGKKYLVLLAPKQKIILAEKITLNQIQHNTLCKYFKSLNVSYISINWESIMSDIGTNDTFQLELKNFINDYLHEELTKMDIKLLKEPNLPTAIEKIFSYVSQTRDKLDHPSFKNGRMSQSILSYGFYIKHKYFKLWFGYNLPLWNSICSPVVLQIRRGWISSKDDEILNIIKTLNFNYDNNSEYILKIELDNYDYWHKDIYNIIDKFELAFDN